MRLEAGVLRGDAAEDGPIFVGIAARHSGHKAVTNDAGNGHRDAGGFRGLQDEANVFQTKLRGKTCWFMLAFNNEAAVSLVDRSVKEGTREKFEESGGVDTRFAGESESFGKRFENRCDQEISGEFHGIGERRLFANDPELWPHRFEERLAFFDCGSGSGSNDSEFRSFGSFVTPKNGSSDELLASLRVSGRKAITQRNANRAKRNVHTILRKRSKNGIFAKNNRFQCRIICH